MEDMEDIEDMVVMGTMDEEEDTMETLKMKEEGNNNDMMITLFVFILFYSFVV